uniref:uncharacterized protein n=1 Tax=Pristiophorus japonicus TaxID=55135 RepID=UPI00398E8025
MVLGKGAKKTSATAADQWHTRGGPPTQEPLTDMEIRALSLVGDSNRATTGIGADPLAQDDSEDSDHTDTERPDDRPTTSTSGVTQPSPDFTTGRDVEEEELLILEPVEVGVETEEDTPAPCGPARTSSIMECVFSGFPHGSSDSAGPSRAQQGTPSVAAPLLQRRRLVQKRSVAVGVYQDMVRLSQASGDIGRELLKAMTTIAANIAALSEQQSEDMSRMIIVMERTAVEAMQQSTGSGHGAEFPCAIVVRLLTVLRK